MTPTSPNRIDARMAAVMASNRSALVPYVTAGHPHPDATVEILSAAVAAGADMLELGMPFSDVMADGPVIQKPVSVPLSMAWVWLRCSAWWPSSDRQTKKRRLF